MPTLVADPLGTMLFGIVFTTLGILFMTKPDWFLRVSIWPQKKTMDGKYKPGRRAKIAFKIIGFIFTAFGLIALYMKFFL